jgi:ribosomal subunit interface protein
VSLVLVSSTEVRVDIVVKGRNVEVPEHFRQHVTEKLDHLTRYDQKLIRIDVELFHEPNPRQAAKCQCVELTCVSRGPLVRSEACAADFYSALYAALAKLERRLRKAADQRRVHYGRRTPISVAEATGALPADAWLAPEGARSETSVGLLEREPDEVLGLIAREKEHAATPMTADQALFEMELVGHDFYLFQNAETGRPSVVYRRKGYDYGVISLVT